MLHLRIASIKVLQQDTKRYVGGIVGYNQADSTIADAQAIFLTMIILFTI